MHLLLQLHADPLYSPSEPPQSFRVVGSARDFKIRNLTPATAYNVTLTPLNGAKTVWVRIRDVALNPVGPVADAVDLVVFIERYGTGRRVSKIETVEGLNDNEYIMKKVEATGWA